MSLGRATCQLLGNRSCHGQSLKSYGVVPSGPHGGEPPGLVWRLQMGDTGGGPHHLSVPLPTRVPRSGSHQCSASWPALPSVPVKLWALGE